MTPGTLTLVQEESGPRYYLDGRPVHAGDVLELQLADGTWQAGGYEWSYQERERPMFNLRIASTAADAGWTRASIAIPRGAILRWPGRGTK